MRVVMARLLSEGEQGIPTACAAFAQQPAGGHVAAWLG
uniref:Chromosome 6 open reading frame 48 n=1 Tax=Homo sapiens TaxID=9606 RepID=Q7KZJ2_HUMAN